MTFIQKNHNFFHSNFRPADHTHIGYSWHAFECTLKEISGYHEEILTWINKHECIHCTDNYVFTVGQMLILNAHFVCFYTLKYDSVVIDSMLTA